MHVLGSEVLATNYDDLTARCVEWAQAPRCTAVEFANTQVVAMRLHEPEFARHSSAFDVVVPDGMPLVWCLNAAGARLTERVYGPTFMRLFLERAPKASTHYLLGGSVACGDRLIERFGTANPGLRFVGRFHGKAHDDGTLDDDAQVIEALNALSPDFIWVGLGTPRQQAWISRHKALLRRGVVLSVGFAFDVNAGLKPDAPEWMQRRGLTWAHRLLSEPRRLGPRYLKWNSLFLYYLARRAMAGQAFGHER